MKEDMTIILSLYPNALGLGYSCLELPEKTLLDSGVVVVRPFRSKRILERIAKFVEFFKPTIIIVKDWDSNYSRRSRRIAQLTDDIVKYAAEMKVPVYRYSRQQIRDVFEVHGAKTKYEIAQKIIVWFKELASRAPKIRKPWMTEDHNMGVFDALSLIITHLYLTE